MSEPKRLFFDIESTRLEADWGVILCIGYRLGSGKIEIPTIHDFPHKDILDDKGLVRHFAEDVYPKADFSIGHYSTYFDIPYINSRLIHHDLPVLPKTHHIDTWKVARYKMKLSNNRLNNLQSFLRSKHSKTEVDKEHWRRATIGCTKSLKYIVQHCKYDILVLEEIYAKLGHLVDEPNHYLFSDLGGGGCVSCGSSHLQRRGFDYTRTRKYQRMQCQDCARWQRAKKSEPLVVEMA